MHPYRDAPCHPEAAPAEVDMEAEEARFADPCCGNCSRRGEGFNKSASQRCKHNNPPGRWWHKTTPGEWCVDWAAA